MKTPSQWNDILIQCGVRHLTVANRVKVDKSIGKKVSESLNAALGFGDGSLVKKPLKNMAGFDLKHLVNPITKN
jgi:hypothetical protein